MLNNVFSSLKKIHALNHADLTGRGALLGLWESLSAAVFPGPSDSICRVEEEPCHAVIFLAFVLKLQFSQGYLPRFKNR